MTLSGEDGAGVVQLSFPKCAENQSQQFSCGLTNTEQEKGLILISASDLGYAATDWPFGSRVELQQPVQSAPTACISCCRRRPQCFLPTSQCSCLEFFLLKCLLLSLLTLSCWLWPIAGLLNLDISPFVSHLSHPESQ